MRQEEAGKLGSKSDWVKHAEVIGKCWTLQLLQCKLFNFVDMGCGSLHQHCTKYLQVHISSRVWLFILSYLTLLLATFPRYHGWKRVPACNLANRIKLCSRPGSSTCNLEARNMWNLYTFNSWSMSVYPIHLFTSAKQKWWYESGLVLELQRWPTSSNEIYGK